MQGLTHSNWVNLDNSWVSMYKLTYYQNCTNCKMCVNVGPIGGSGGNGGSVVLVADRRFNTLMRFKGSASFKAENGMDGACGFANGRFGPDCVVEVPPGTVVRDNSTGNVVGELSYHNDKLVVAMGGLGGQGNAAASGKAGGGGKGKGNVRIACQPPQGGERRCLKLELNLVADVGLVGIPNAGKSTLLDAVTNARPKIAAYPFTTIVPNLGVCDVSAANYAPIPLSPPRQQNTDSSNDAPAPAPTTDPMKRSSGKQTLLGQTMVLADIPGLLEGAHRGIGLGRGFLRHVERCKIIIHVINGDSADPAGDLRAINRELQLFSPALARKPQIVVLNKIDLPHVAARQTELMRALRGEMSHSRLLPISAAARIGVGELVRKTWNFLKKVESDEAQDTAGDSNIAPMENKNEISCVLQVEIANEAECIAGLAAPIVRVSGAAVQAIIREHRMGGDSSTDSGVDAPYYGSIERRDALLEALGVAEAIREVLAGKDAAGTPAPANKEEQTRNLPFYCNNVNVQSEVVKCVKVLFSQPGENDFILYLMNNNVFSSVAT